MKTIFNRRKRKIEQLEKELNDSNIQKKHLTDSQETLINRLTEKDEELEVFKGHIVSAASTVNNLKGEIAKLNSSTKTRELIDSISKEISKKS